MRKDALEKALADAAKDTTITDETKRGAAMATIRGQLRSLSLLQQAQSDVAGVAAALAGIEDHDEPLPDELRVLLISKLREAINNIHEAG